VTAAAAAAVRYWLQGPKAGSAEVFMDNLPGPPDGISLAGDGVNFWVTIYSEVRIFVCLV
jgi:sugar lactone lactonase YvrE